MSTKTELEKEVEGLKAQLEDQSCAVVEGASTKQQLLLALAPQVNISHPLSSAQKVLAAVDVIMEVWGME